MTDRDIETEVVLFRDLQDHVIETLESSGFTPDMLVHFAISLIDRACCGDRSLILETLQTCQQLYAHIPPDYFKDAEKPS
jgi:hypothetical protein